MAQTSRPFTELNNSYTEPSSMFEFPPNEETFPWNKIEEEDKDNGDTGLPSGD